MLTRLAIQHEDMINTSKLDRGLVLYMGQGPSSLTEVLYKVSQGAKSRRESLAQNPAGQQAPIVAPLRVLLFRAFLQEVKGRQAVKDKQMLLETGWTFRAWVPAKKALANTDQKPLGPDEVCSLLDTIHKNANESTILLFASHRKLPTEPTDKPVVFLLEISNRGPNADELHQALRQLTCNSIRGLVGVQMCQDTLRRSGLAQRLGREILGWK